MRFHIGFSKRISKKTIIFLLGLLSVAFAIFFGNTEVVFAENKDIAPSTVYYRSNTVSPYQITPNVTLSGDLYVYNPTNSGSAAYDFTTIYDFSNICSTGRGSIQINQYGMFNSSVGMLSGYFNIVHTDGTSFGSSIVSSSGNWYSIKTGVIDLTKQVKVTMNTSSGELANAIYYSKVIDVNCTTDGTDAIIDNATQNTQDIINNQNSNTNSIINNQNSNTQSIIDSNSVCNVINYKYDSSFVSGYLNSSGSIVGSSYTRVGNYIPVNSSSSIITIRGTSVQSIHYCFYDFNKSVISCTSEGSLSDGDNVPIPNNASFFRATFYDTYPTFSIKSCTNGSQAISDSLTDDNVSTANTTGSNLFGNFQINDTRGLTSVITAPIRLLQGIINSNDSCDPYTFNIQILGTESKTVSLPSGCILWNNVPQLVVVSYWVIVWAIVGYRILADMIHFTSSLRDPDHKNDYTLDL